MTPVAATPPELAALELVLESYRGRYRDLNGAASLAAYLDRPRPREDEEMLTEPVLASILERVLGFPVDAYFPQLGRSGLKPDFTPIDLVAHRFVLDAKSSTQDLAAHETQIRTYIDQRHLDCGVLFNLRELRVYRRGLAGHDPDLSFDVRRLWEVARGEALATEEVDRFVRFCELFRHRAMGYDAKVRLVAEAEPWRDRAGAGEELEIDLDFLVSQLRTLSRELADDAAAQHERLLAGLELEPDRERKLRLELETLAREIEPGIAPDDLPPTAAGYRDADGVARRAWKQYLMRVSQLTLTRILLYRSWEDAGFVEDRLYDGGFDQAYERLDHNLRRVLDEAFSLGRERYRWLFGDDNNYDWYRPRDEGLADVLYALVPFPLGRLGADVLGGLYESYVDDIDRDRLGQFYTPRAVVRFMLDRAGFAGPEGVFHLAGDGRDERQIFDFATGSGGFGLVPLDALKERPYAEIRKDAAFDLVIGNPPYVSEAGNKVLFERLRALPGWQDVYRGKSDYLYYFLAMAAEKVAPGGHLCVITPAGWMNAGNADWLRERLASSLRLDELFLFGSMRLFATEDAEKDVRAGAAPPTVESAILVATRTEAPDDHKLRVVLLEDEIEAAVALTGKPDARVPPRDRLLGAMTARAAGKPGRKDGILVHDVPQADLRSKQPWPIKHAARDTASSVVKHLQARLDAKRNSVERLAERWVVAQGIQTGADAYSSRVQKRLSQQVKEALTRQGRATGDPILELPAGMEHEEPWRSHPEVLARSPEPRALLYGAVDDADYASLVWLRATDHPPQTILDALEPWREVLRTRAEFARNPRRAWWETAWPRDVESLRGPKVIALYRTDRGRFALDEAGDWQPSIKTTLAMPRESDLSVAYLCGLLNSELLDLWYAVRGKTPWHVRRNYEPKPMNEMPYRHVPTPDGWTPGPDVLALADALAAGDVKRAVASAGRVRASVGTAAGDADARTAIEHLVRAVASNRRELLPLRPLAPELRRAVKNPWRTHGVEVDPGGVLASLPDADVRSVRVDPALTLTIVSDGMLGKPKLEDGVLSFRHGRKLTATVEGPADRLTLLSQMAPADGRLMPDDLRGLRVPADLEAFEAATAAREQEIQGLLDAGRALVEAVERLVCALYGVPDALTERVIESAVSRAGSAGSEDE